MENLKYKFEKYLKSLNKDVIILKCNLTINNQVPLACIAQVFGFERSQILDKFTSCKQANPHCKDILEVAICYSDYKKYLK